MWLDRTDTAIQESDDALRKVLASFRYRIPTKLPHDPFSPAYTAAQWELYQQVSGRTSYAAALSEQSWLDLESLVERPFPYYTMSSETVGNQLVMEGLVIKHLGLSPRSEILEFGPGCGNLALSLALMEHHVTAVDISPDYVELIRRRADRLGLAVTLICDSMLTFKCDRTYDAVVFFESFHHCADHMEMLGRLHSLVKDNGKVIFGFEPITKQAEPWGNYPWGVRLDGMSVWSARKFGWLELGFTEEYFLEALSRSGWQGTVKHFDATVYGTIVIARKRAAVSRWAGASGQ